MHVCLKVKYSKIFRISNIDFRKNHKRKTTLIITFMLHLFRRKMVFVVKYFSAFGTHEKITKGENAIVAGIRQHLVAVVGFRRACLAGSSQTPPDPAGSMDGFVQVRPDPSHFG
jgi:hypothetical protein